MYAEDSFHTLSSAGQFGLVLLSVALSIALLWVGWQLMARRRLVTRIGLALGLFYVFVWLSPQIYYAYYFVLFDGLPWQIVVKKPPNPGSFLKLLSFQGSSTLSAHSLGALGSALILMAFVRSRAVAEPRPDDRV